MRSMSARWSAVSCCWSVTNNQDACRGERRRLSTIALGLEFTRELRAIVTALLPPLTQVGQIGSEFALALARRRALRKDSSTHRAMHHFATDMQLTGDCAQAQPRSMQRDDLLITLTRKTRRPCRKRLQASLPLSHATVLFAFPRQVSDRLRGLLLSTPPFSERCLTNAYAAHHEVVPISDLPGVRGTTCGCLRIRPRTIPADDLHASMHTQPTDDGISIPIRQQLDRAMSLQIDQQRAIAIPFFPGEIVQAQYARGLVLGNSRAADESQKSIAAGGHREALRQLRTCFASLREGDLGEGLGLAQRSPGVGVCQLWKAFGKGGTRAAPGAAYKAAHLQAHAHCSSLTWEIGKSARVATSHAGRCMRALGADGAGLARFQHQGQCLLLETDIGQIDISRQRE